MLGIDCTSYPSAKAVLDAGLSFVWGYISNPGNRKNITRAKVQEYADAGIGVPLIFETTAARAGLGYPAGTTDASSGIAQQIVLGIPTVYEIYYAVDYDATGAAVVPYFQGLHDVPGPDSSYGGIKVISTLLDMRLVHHAWQTAAWSKGQTDPRIAVFQRVGTIVVDGISCDVDESFVPYFGQYPFTEENTVTSFFDQGNNAEVAARRLEALIEGTDVRGPLPQSNELLALLRAIAKDTAATRTMVSDLVNGGGVGLIAEGQIVVHARTPGSES